MTYGLRLQSVNGWEIDDVGNTSSKRLRVKAINNVRSDATCSESEAI